MQIVHVVGARPNFMKAAPVLAALAKRPHITQLLVHTGQHYDAQMSDIFFQQLGLPQPDVNLHVGSGSHAVQTAEVMIRFEAVLLEQRPDLVLVYGDVNSTVAAALVCAKLQVPIGHVEAGLRSFDRSMPEEINRLVTDQIADLLFTPSADADQHLLHEGVAAERIRLVGNVMIDTLIRLLPIAETNWPGLQHALQLGNEVRYVLATLHRPANVDSVATLHEITQTLQGLAEHVPVIFPIHPRTRQRLQEVDFQPQANFRLIDPVSYLDFLALQQHAALVITDSGGIQEETTFLGVPCLTVRENTERPITITLGTNTLVGRDMERLHQEAHRVLAAGGKAGSIPPLWDGKAAERIAAIIETLA